MTFQLLFQYLWIFFIAYNFITIYKWKKYLVKKELIHEQNEEEFDSLKKGYFVFASIPWLCIGLYSEITSISVPIDFMSPYKNPQAYWFIVCVSSITILWEIYWVYFKGGALKLSKYPGLLDIKSVNPLTYKLFSVLGLVAIIGFLIMSHLFETT